MNDDARASIPPAPRRLSVKSLRRLRRDALLPRLFGAIWCATGAVMLVVFLVLADPTVDFRIRRNHTTATGTVTEVTRRGNRNPYRIAYTFTAGDGVEYAGRSFSSRRRGLSGGNEVTVEYVPADPALSRIEGMRYASIPQTMYLLGLLFFVVGGMIWTTGVLKFGRMRRLCEQGSVTTGTVVAARWNKLMRMKTSPRTPRRILYELRYRFRDDRGRERESSQRTYAVADSFDFKEGDTITVLFDRANPARSLALDVLELEFTADLRR